jgi:ATP-dependent DNA helicase RecG
LIRQGLVVESNGMFEPSGFGNILFGKTPREATPQAVVLGTIHRSDGTEEQKDFDGPQAMMPEQALQWVESRLPDVIDRSNAVRRSSLEVIKTLIREGLVNAIVHRDYDVQQAKCQLKVYPTHVEILSPGHPVDPITLDQMQSFNAPMLSRNPIIHFVFAKMKLAEERGLGLKSLREKALEAGLPRPKYEWRAPYLVLTIFLNPEAAVKALPSEITSQLSDSEREGWQWLALKGDTSAKEYATYMGVDPRTARRHLNRFVELYLAEKLGDGSKTRYHSR